MGNKPKRNKIRVTGRLIVLQQVGEMVDGKLHFVAGRDQDVFHIEDGDKFFTAVFAIDPFKGTNGENEVPSN